MIFQSADPAVRIPTLSLSDYVMERFEYYGDKPALIDGPTGRTLSYGQLMTDVRRFAAALAKRGMNKGDVFAILLPNIPEYAIALLGVAAAGGVVTPLNPILTAEEIRFQLRDTDAHWLLTSAPLSLHARDASQGTAVREVFSVGDAPGATPFNSLLLNNDPLPPVRIDPVEDLVALPYSSGTSGLSKGVMLTHRNVVAQISQACFVFNGASEGPVAAVAPFFHVLGMVLILLLALKRGAAVVVLPRFELEQFLHCMQKYRIKYTMLVPPIILALAKHPSVDRYDLSSLEWMLCGAAPLGGEVEQACADRLGCFLGQGWGMTEICGGGVSVRPSDTQPILRGSCGRLWPGVEARIVDFSAGFDLGAGQTGELLVRGPNVMKGYLNRADANAETLVGDGWMRTGDVAYVDANGHLYIVDRIKELIKYNAYQIAPAELEAVLVLHAAVAEAAVIPCPDTEHGEVPKAFVVLKAPATPEELMEFVAAHVAPYKKVRKLVIVDAIPKSAAGKLLRRVLVQQDRLARH